MERFSHRPKHEKDPRKLTLTTQLEDDGSVHQILSGELPEDETFVIPGTRGRKIQKSLRAGTHISLTAIINEKRISYGGRIGEIHVGKRDDNYLRNQTLAASVFNRFATPKTTKFP